MPYFYDPIKNINVLFIHIPKTGGTSVEHYFYKNKNIKRTIESLYSNKTSGYERFKKPEFNNYSLQHQSYNTIMKYKNMFKINPTKLRTFAVVRNPYYRTISDLFYFKLIKPDDKPDKVYQALKTYLDKKNYDNHNIPQYLFVTDKNNNLHKNIFIMKTEKLNDDMKRYGYKDFDIVANNNKNKDVKKTNSDNIYNKYLNNDSIILINKIFQKDFKLFKYPMKKTEIVIKPIIENPIII
jgi:hypothetical protein